MKLGSLSLSNSMLNDPSLPEQILKMTPPPAKKKNSTGLVIYIFQR